MSKIYDFTNEELKTSIKNIGLSTRAKHSLLTYNINTLHDLINAIESTGLKNIRNMGKTSIAEVMKKLEEMKTPTWREKQARLREFEYKTAEIKAEIAKHQSKIAELNNCLAQIEKIKDL